METLQYTPNALYLEGINMLNDIQNAIEETAPYYAGTSAKRPVRLLSDVYDPDNGPIMDYFSLTARLLNEFLAKGLPLDSPDLPRFHAASDRQLDALSALAETLRPLLPAGHDKKLREAIRSFSYAKDVFFAEIENKRHNFLLQLAMPVAVAIGLSKAKQYVLDIRMAFKAREDVLAGLPTEDVKTLLARLADGVQKITRRVGNNRRPSGIPTQKEAAVAFCVDRQTINKWEREQTVDGPDNTSNPYGYYKSLRTNPDLRPAYEELARCAQRYHALRQEAKRKGRPMVRFVAFRDAWLRHMP